MEKLVYISVVVTGIVFAITVYLLLYILWRYSIKKQWLKENTNEKNSETFLVQKMKSTSPDAFLIPKPYKAVKQQFQEDGEESQLLPTVTLTDETTSHIIVTPMDQERKFQRFVSTTSTKQTQRREYITQRMFSSLKGLRRKDLHCDSDNSHSISSLDMSGESYNGEEFDAPTADNTRKRKIGKRRLPSNQPEKLSHRTYRKNGRVEFTSEYDEKERLLTIQIIAAKNIALHRDINELNPFLRVYLDPGKKQRQDSKYVKHQRDISFNKVFKFNNISTEDYSKYRLKIKVLNHAKFRSNEVLGEVELDLLSMNMQYKERFNVDLFIKRSESYLSSVLIGIRHEPAFSKLDVQIEKAKNIPKGTHTHHNPYIVVTLYAENNEDRKNTVVIRNTRNPSFEELFHFYLITDFETPLTTFSLVATLMNHTLIGRDEILGHVIFSLSSPTQSASEQWQEVENVPYKLITQWHSMVGPDEI